MSINNLIARFFANKATKEEWDTLESWKLESKENLNELKEMQSIWERALDLDDYKEFDKNSAWASINDTIEESIIPPIKKRKTLVLNFKWVAGIAAAISLVIFSVISYPTTEIEGYTQFVSTDEVEDLNLPDGSLISLNKNSKMDYAVNFTENRNVILDGEAYFEVARDEEKPFNIITDCANITVLGTSFNVEEGKDFVNVFVTSGSVKVVSGSEEVILSKNDMVKCDCNKIEKINNPSRNYLSWKNDKLIFQETPLHKVVSDLAHHYNVNLTFSGASTDMNKPVTDVFENEDFESVMETIVLITGIQYISEGNNYVIQ